MSRSLQMLEEAGGIHELFPLAWNPYRLFMCCNDFFVIGKLMAARLYKSKTQNDCSVGSVRWFLSLSERSVPEVRTEQLTPKSCPRLIRKIDALQLITL